MPDRGRLPLNLALVRACRSLILLSCFASLFSEVVAQTGTVTKIHKEGDGKVAWDSGAPPDGSVGTVVSRNRLLGIFLVLSSKEQTSTVQFMDAVLPGLIKKDQKVKLLDLEPYSVPPEQTSILVWSDHWGSPFTVDGKPSGQAPTKVILLPGFHEVLLDLAEGGKAGARIETHKGDEFFLCLHGRSWPSPEGEDGYPQFVPLVSFPIIPDRPTPLRWLEDRHGERVYAYPGPLKGPTVKTRTSPLFPESMRKARREGMVVFDAILDSDGRILQLDEVVSPDPQFTLAAKDAVLQWVYDPATLDGKPVRIFFQIAVDFYLHS